jgi:N-glycosylase/DNA lyase
MPPLLNTSENNQKFTIYSDSISWGFILPGPDEFVVPGVKWGAPELLFTPEYWAALCWVEQCSGCSKSLRLGETFIEETAACLLGGYGIKAEVGIAAFNRLRDVGLLSGDSVEESEIFRVLEQPLNIGGREVRYRFAKQRSHYLCETINGIVQEVPPEDDLQLREWLLKFPGVGLKTASWITRNWKESDSVAVIDVHILRAGKMVGLFNGQKPETDYLELEGIFLKFADSMNVRPSVLDTLMWSQMRKWGYLAQDSD